MGNTLYKECNKKEYGNRLLHHTKVNAILYQEVILIT